MNIPSNVRKIAVCALALLFASMTAPLVLPPFATAWSNLYPNSPSLDHVFDGTGTSCQLCHRDTGGGDPWNSYGWAIKQLTDGGETETNAMMMVEAANSDGDAGGFSNLDEITSGAQPGWTVGPNNTIHFDDGSTATGQMPPAGILLPLDPVANPTIVRNGTGVNPIVLTDSGGDPNTSPRLGSVAEPFAVTIDCSNASASGVYAIQIRPTLAATPSMTAFGELLFLGPTLFKSSGLHNQSAVGLPPITLPYDVSLLNVTYYVQGFCGSSAGGAFLSNALEQSLGI